MSCIPFMYVVNLWMKCDFWVTGFSQWFWSIGYFAALRVSLSVTWLTVYHKLQITAGKTRRASSQQEKCCLITIIAHTCQNTFACEIAICKPMDKDPGSWTENEKKSGENHSSSGAKSRTQNCFSHISLVVGCFAVKYRSHDVVCQSSITIL